MTERKPRVKLRQFKLRLPDKLHAKLKAAGKKSDRSLNGEIVARLAGSFDREAAMEVAELIRRKVLQKGAG